jgi:hypothetical protein
MSQAWYYAQGSKVYGPVHVAQLRALAQAGRLRPSDMVVRAGEKRWGAAAAQPWLFAPVPRAAAVAPVARPQSNRGLLAVAGGLSTMLLLVVLALAVLPAMQRPSAKVPAAPIAAAPEVQKPSFETDLNQAKLNLADTNTQLAALKEQLATLKQDSAKDDLKTEVATLKTELGKDAATIKDLQDRLAKLNTQAKGKVYPKLAPVTLSAKAFDWTQHGFNTPVRDQGKSDTCWAFACTQALEANWFLRTQKKVILGPQPILDLTQTSKAYHVHAAFTALKNYGTTLEALYPFTLQPGTPKSVPTPYRAENWGFVSANGDIPIVADTKKALCEHGPLVVVLAITPLFQKHRDGVLNETMDPKAKHFFHAVVLVGWDDGKGAWKIKNSWSTQWGEQGYGWVGYHSNHIGISAAWVECAK